MLLFGWDETAIAMDRDKRIKMNYNNYTILLQQMKPLRKILFGFDTLIINELLDNPLSIIKNDRIMVKSRTAYFVHENNQITTINKILYFFKVIIRFLSSHHSTSTEPL
jgi:hypothetical protein